jgi:hypothetical protein
LPPSSSSSSSSLGTLYVNLSSICSKIFALHLHHHYHHLDDEDNNNNNNNDQIHVLEVMWLLLADLS